MTALSVEDLLARLVAFDTTSCNSNLAMADFIGDYLDGPGVTVTRVPAPDADKVCLLVRTGPDRTDRAGLTLSGHMDVVPATEDGWSTDPFRLSPRDDTVVGRGSCDMKGFLALAVHEFRQRASGRLTHPLALLFTYDEEVGTLGARHFVETFTPVDVIPARTIIGEPTGLAPVRMHKGHLKLRVILEGVAAHSGLPHLGRSAIEPAGRVITALGALRAELEAERPPHAEHFPDVPYPALNIAMVAGGRAINVVPDRCVLEVGVRTLPGMSATEVTGRVESALKDALGTDFTLEVGGESPPMLLPHDDDLLDSLGRHTHDHGASFATDAGWLQEIGCRCVLWGPGDMNNAHRPNESIPRADLVAAQTRLTALVDHWCTT